MTIKLKTRFLIFLIINCGLAGTAIILYLYDFEKDDVSRNKVEIFTSPYITEFSIPTSSSVPNGIGVDKDDRIWFVENKGNKLAMFDKNSYLLTEYKIPGDIGEVWSVDFDKDGNLWFTDSSDRIWMFDIARKSFKSYDVPTKGSRPTDIVIDNDDKIWITQLRNNYSEEGDRVVVFDPILEKFSEYKLTDKSGPAGVVFDKGNLWITQTYSHNIARFNTGNFSYQQFTPSQNSVSPIGIAVDAKGAIWFAQHGASKVSRFIESNQTLFEFTTSPNPEFPITTPYWILIDSKQNIWFNEHSPNKIAKFDKANNTLIEYKIPSERGELVNALTIALDHNDNPWFTEWTRNRIGFVDSKIPVPFTIDISPDAATVDAGENLSFDVTVTPINVNEIRRVYFNASSTITPTGEFVNSTISFEPKQVDLGNTNQKTRLFFHTEPELTRGEYNITVSASDGFITYARIVTLQVR